MNKQKLSDYINRYTKIQKDIEVYFSKKDISFGSISEYSSLCSAPLLVIYVTLIRKKANKDLLNRLNFLCDFYDIENDIIKNGHNDLSEQKGE